MLKGYLRLLFLFDLKGRGLTKWLYKNSWLRQLMLVMLNLFQHLGLMETLKRVQGDGQ